MAVGVLVAYLFLPISPPYSRTGEYCVICRGERFHHQLLLCSWDSYSDTSCSHWYRANVERRHGHVWDAIPQCQRRGSILMPVIACRFAHSPVRDLSPDEQFEFYKHCGDPGDARCMFASLADPDFANAGGPDGRGRRLIGAIAAWSSAGFPGTWDDWLSRDDPEVAARRVEWQQSRRAKPFWEWWRLRRPSR